MLPMADPSAEELEDAGLVEIRREGRYKFHDINTAPLEPIAARWLKPGKGSP